MLDVIRDGSAQPNPQSADSGGVGHAESGSPTSRSQTVSILLRVRERWITGQLPTENISDRYTIQAGSWLEIEAGLGKRGERLARACKSTWRWGQRSADTSAGAGDVDTYCLQDTAPGVHVELSPIHGVDGVLRVVRPCALRAAASLTRRAFRLQPRSCTSKRVRDDLCIRGERGRDRGSCALRASAENAYTITFRAGDAPT